MLKNKEPIYWRGDLVGYIGDPVKYPVMWRGQWLPEANSATQEFLKTLERGYPIWVEYGSHAPKDMAQVKILPMTEIELNLDIEEEETIFTNPSLDN